MEYVHWLITILGVYEVFTVPLYLRIVFVLITNKQFRHPFYLFITFLSIMDMIHYELEFLFYRLTFLAPFIGIFTALAPSWWIGFIGFLVYFFTYQQFMLHVVITLNRFTGILLPFRHKLFWHRFWRSFIVCPVLIAVILASDQLFCLAKFWPIVGNDTSLGLIAAPTQYFLYHLDSIVVSITLGSFCALFCLAMNSASLLRIWYLKRTGKLQEFQQSMRLELNFLLVAVFMMVPQFVVVAYHILLQLTMNQNFSLYTLETQMPWIDDLFSLSQPWILMVICKDLRESVIRPFGLKPKNKVVVVKHLNKIAVNPYKANSHC